MGLTRHLFERRACQDEEGTFWSLVSVEPPIVYLQGSRKHMIWLHRALRGVRAFLLRGPIGCEDFPKYARRWKRYHVAARRLHPEHEVVFLTNTPRSTQFFQARGLPAVLCSQNGLLDERLFTVRAGVPEQFDAVYNAQMEAVKRHPLACEVGSLALITYRLESEPEYYRQVQAQLRQATWLNFEAGEYRWIPTDELSSKLQRARVGLSLSAKEGANYATVEYLLSGLPVVTTESLGGRDLFYDDDHVAVVPATAAAVRRGVEELISRDLDPHAIRERTLARMRPHRQVFIDLLQRCCDRAGVARDVQAEWPQLFSNKMLSWQRMHMIRSRTPVRDFATG